MFEYEIVIDTKKEYKICPKCGRLYEARFNYCGSHEDTIELVRVRFE